MTQRELERTFGWFAALAWTCLVLILVAPALTFSLMEQTPTQSSAAPTASHRARPAVAAPAPSTVQELKAQAAGTFAAAMVMSAIFWPALITALVFTPLWRFRRRQRIRAEIWAEARNQPRVTGARVAKNAAP